MQIPVALLGSIETAINAWLKLDGDTLPRFASLDGKIIRLHITGLDLNLYFLPSPSGIQVMGNYPDSDQGGMVDATIHGSPMALIRLGTADNSGETLLKTDVEIEGDTRLAETFSEILGEVDIDWEELLSKLVGDIIAHQAGQVVHNMSGWLTETVDALKMNSAEYISEEAQLTPAEAEVRHFMDQVDEMRMGVDRLEARINHLSNVNDKQENENKENRDAKK